MPLYRFSVLDGQSIVYEFLPLLKWKKNKEPKWYFYFPPSTNVPFVVLFLKRYQALTFIEKPEWN